MSALLRTVSICAAGLLQKWTGLPLLVFAPGALAAAASTEQILAEPLVLPDAPETDGAIGEAAPISGALVSIAFATLLVVGLLLVLAWFLRRYGRRLQVGGAGRHLEVMESLPMGLKRSVSLLRCGDRVLVVGMSEQGMHRLGEMAFTCLREEDDEGSAATATDGDPATIDEVGDPVDGFKQRLQELRGETG